MPSRPLANLKVRGSSPDHCICFYEFQPICLLSLFDGIGIGSNSPFVFKKFLGEDGEDGKCYSKMVVILLLFFLNAFKKGGCSVLNINQYMDRY